jgi:hypothetical protein
VTINDVLSSVSYQSYSQSSFEQYRWKVAFRCNLVLHTRIFHVSFTIIELFSFSCVGIFSFGFNFWPLINIYINKISISLILSLDSVVWAIMRDSPVQALSRAWETRRKFYNKNSKVTQAFIILTHILGAAFWPIGFIPGMFQDLVNVISCANLCVDHSKGWTWGSPRGKRFGPYQMVMRFSLPCDPLGTDHQCNPWPDKPTGVLIEYSNPFYML